MTFLKRNPLFALFAGVALVAIGLLSLPIVSEAADAASSPGAACQTQNVRLDDGYGLSGAAVRKVCR